MSIKTTRRGLFTLVAAIAGTGTLVAAKPAEAPAPKPAPETPRGLVHPREGLSPKELNYYFEVVRALRAEGLDSDLWTIDFEYDILDAVNAVTVRSTAYGDRLLYSRIRWAGAESLTPEVARTQASAMAQNVSYIEAES